MSHVHRIVKQFPRPNRSLEELAAYLAGDNLSQPGTVHVTNYLPYPQGTLVEARAELVDGAVVETHIYEPTSGADLAAYWQRRRANWRENHGPIDEELEVDWMAEQKLQEDWVKGVAADATIFCVAEQKDRPWHGHAVYDETAVCNECMRQIERAILAHDPNDPHEWIEDRKGAALIENFIDKCEELGEALRQLPDGRWVQVQALYAFIRHSEYRGDVYEKPHWPYADMLPSMYQVYVRSDWQPGEYFNSPDYEIICTDRNRLFRLINEGPEAFIKDNKRAVRPPR